MKLLAIILPLLVFAGPLRAEEKLWMNTSGKTMFGTLERATASHAYIKNSDGKTVSIAIMRLDETGRDAVSTWKRAQAKASAPTPGRVLPGHKNRKTEVKTHLRDDAISRAERALADKINAIRQEHGLKPLKYEEDAAVVARAHSANMIAKDFFAHQDPEGRQVWDRLKEGKVRNTGSGENIAVNNHSNPGETAVTGWMNSPGHRENILSTSWSGTGMGIAKGADGAVYFTQVFIR